MGSDGQSVGSLWAVLDSPVDSTFDSLVEVKLGSPVDTWCAAGGQPVTFDEGDGQAWAVMGSDGQ